MSQGVKSTGLHVCCHVITYESPVVSLGFLLLHPEHVAPAPSFMFVQGLLPLPGSAREVETRGRAKNVNNPQNVPEM